MQVSQANLNLNFDANSLQTPGDPWPTSQTILRQGSGGRSGDHQLPTPAPGSGTAPEPVIQPGFFRRGPTPEKPGNRDVQSGSPPTSRKPHRTYRHTDGKPPRGAMGPV